MSADPGCHSARRASTAGRARRLALLAAGAAALGGLLARPVRAQAQVVSRFALHLEGGGAGLVAGLPAQRFGLGVHGQGRLSVQIVGPLHVQLSGGTWWFEPRGGSGPGRLTTVTAGPRLWFRINDGPVGGPVLDANAGMGFTGPLLRFSFDVGAGWEFAPTRWLSLGPMVRYAHVVQPDDATQGSDDAQVLMVSLAVSLRVPPAQPAPPRAPPPAPPRDSDRDGLVDARDACPAVAEDADGFRDDDGCPEPDNDGDGLRDADDRCPDQAEVRNGYQDDDGCADEAPPPAPASQTVVAPEGRPIGEPVTFGYGTAHLHRRVLPAVRALCDELRAHPEYRRVRLVGHADESGSETLNHGLSARRSSEVALALMRCGIAPERLESAAMGSSRPACTERDRECWRRNRRVQAVVVEP